MKLTNRWLMAFSAVALSMNALATNPIMNVMSEGAVVAEMTNKDDKPLVIYIVTDEKTGEVQRFTRDKKEAGRNGNMPFDYTRITIDGRQATDAEVRDYENWTIIGLGFDGQGKDAIMDVLTDKCPDIDPNDESVHLAVQEFAAYKEGPQALMDFLAQNLKYPKIAMDNKVQGRVLTRYVVMKDGTVGNLEILRNVPLDAMVESGKITSATAKSISKALEDECIRVVNLTSGKWNPAKIKGAPVKFTFTLPITFRMK